MANDDAQTDLKKRARRRLVGAAALALFAVIVLPMIMDPEPKPAGEDIEVRIPPVTGVNVAERTIAPAAPVVSEPSTPTTMPKAEVKPLEPATAAVAEKPVAKAPQAKDESTGKPVSKPAVADAPTPAGAAKPTSEEAQRVAAILSGAPVSAAKVGDEFIVQVGAFSNAASASALAEKIRQAGFKAYTRKIGSTTRVRVGPFADRDAAESEATRMSGKGFKGVVMPRG